MTSSSATQPRSRAARTILPIRGSTGKRASSRPSGVRLRPASTAPSSCSSWKPSAIARGPGGSTNGNASTSPSRERRHPQDHRRERAAQDLGIGVLRPGREIVLAVEAHADAVGDAPAAARPLVRRRLRDLLDLQQRRLVAQRIALHARETGIDHVPDPRYRERGLGDVGREDDAPPPRRREHALLLRHRQPCVERQDLDGSRIRPPREALVQQVGGLADLPLAREEDEDIAGPRAPEILRGIHDRVLEFLLVVGFLARGLERPVAHIDRVHPARHLDHRRGRAFAAEVAREAIGVEGGRSDDHLEVGPLRQQLLHVAQQEIDVEAALVRLVDDERVVRGEQRVALRLGEQDAVGHQLDERVGLRVVGEPDLVADDGAELGREFLRDSLGDGARGDPPRLRVADQAALATSFRQADLRQLRRLARPGLAAHDHDLMLADRPGDVGRALRHREFRRVGDGRPALRAGLPALDRTCDGSGDPLPIRCRRVPAARALDPAAKRYRVRGHPLRELREQAGCGRRRSHWTTFALRAPVSSPSGPGLPCAARPYSPLGRPFGLMRCREALRGASAADGPA